MADGKLTIQDLRGGMNNTDAPHILPDDQCVLAQNVEFWLSELGERRKGMNEVDLTGAGVANEDTIVHGGVYLPLQATLQNNEIFVVGMTEGVSYTVSHRDTLYVWTDVTPQDAPLLTFPVALHMQSKTGHGKWYWGYQSAVDRMHLWDGTSLRRAGIKAPLLPPTAADSGVAGSFTGDRTYRVRFVKMSGIVVLLRSEPSGELTFSPVGTDDGVIVTRPAALNEGETHWELEASDGDGNFYRIALTVMATTTATDTIQPAADYIDYPLSEDVGEYDLIPSFKYIVMDEDRFIFANQYEDSEKGSRVAWTPVWAAPGVGNDERIPSDTDNFKDLDWMDGGNITGMSSPINGVFYVFKENRVYKAQRTGILNDAYEFYLLLPTIGAIDGSVVDGVDEGGAACVYFLDPAIGPCRVGASGFQQIDNLRETWALVNTSAANIVAHGYYYPDKKQVHWYLALNGADTPNYKIISQTNEIRGGSETGGAQRGWAVATGDITEAYCSFVVPEVVYDQDTGSTYLSFRPYLGFNGANLLQRSDVGSTDNGQRYRGIILTKCYIMAGLLDWYGMMMGGLLADAISDPKTRLRVRLIRDFGVEEQEIFTNFIPEKQERYVIKLFDDLHMSHAHAIQIEFSDPIVSGIV